MNAEQHVPPFRFKGFSDFWEQRKLSDLAMFNPRLELPDSFQYVDLESVSGTELINHRTETKSSAPSRAQRLAKKGDIFYQTVRPYQKNNYLYEKSDDDYVFSTGYVQLRPYEDGYFLFSRLQENGFVSTVLDHSTGTSYPAINSNDLAKLEIMVPLNLNEQQAIGKLFRHIDNAIALHQHKLAKLKELKKGYLQKLFPQNGETVPEFRFKGYSDAWEKRKLREVSDVRDGTHASPKYYSQGYPLVTSKNLTSAGLDFSNISLISELDYKNINKRSRVDKGDILFGMIGTIGTPVMVHESNFAIKNVALIKEREAVLNSFLVQLLKSPAFINYIRNENVGGTQKFLSLNTIRNFRFSFPTSKEQAMVSRFLEKIDSLIAATQHKVDLLKKLKQGYLQKMFC